jgi:hypothetical protein
MNQSPGIDAFFLKRLNVFHREIFSDNTHKPDVGEITRTERKVSCGAPKKIFVSSLWGLYAIKSHTTNDQYL